RLRARILDPVLARSGDVHVLHVIPDDCLFLVPLDALPLDDQLVGERYAVRVEVSFARMLHPAPASGSEPRLGLAGGIDCAAAPAPGADPRLGAALPPVEPSPERSGSASSGFVPLPGTSAELASIARLFGDAFEAKPSVLDGPRATKAALAEQGRGARFLHLATHGWFAPEVFRSQLDAQLDRGDAERRGVLATAEETARGFAPP